MKKFIVSSFAAIALIAGTSAYAATAKDMGTSTIGYKSPMMYVQNTQENLNVCAGATPALVVDGKYGSKTTMAAKNFQMAKGLSVDGKIGPMTKAALIAACGGTTPTPTPTPGTGITTGTAGSITTTQLSTYTSQNVAKGAVDKMVSEFKVKATGSDVKVTSMGVKLAFSGAGSARIEKYLNSVSIFNGNTKVGEISAAAFTQESSANIYSANVVFNNPATIAVGTEQKFVIAINALPEIDSLNLGSVNNTWTATANQIRYTDGTGAILIDSSTQPAQNFYFTALSSSVNTEAQFSLASTNPKAQSVRVDTGSNTNGVKLLDATVKAQGSDMYFDDVVVKLTVATSAGTVKVSDIVSNLKLNIAGTEYSASPTSFVACTTAVALTTNCDVIFYDVNYQKVAKDASVPMTVTADIKNINATVFDEGDTVKAEITSTQYNATRIEDMNRDSLPTAKRTGSSIGEVMTLQSKGISLSYIGSSTAVTAGTGTPDDVGTFNINFRVTANGGDMFIARSATGMYAADRAGVAALAPGLSGVLVDTSDAQTGASAMSYKIANGSSEDFTLTVAVSDATAGGAGLYRTIMNAIAWSANGDDAVYENSFTISTFNFNDFKTGYVSLN